MANSQAKHPMPADGCWINLFDPDMEHSPSSLDNALPVIRAVQSSGAKAIVRVPDKQPEWIGRLMDMGADGAMVPMVNNGEEGYGVNTADYLDNYRQNFLLMLQIETAAAVEAVEVIANTDGVDALFIGPFDLAGSLGHLANPDHPDVQAAIKAVMATVKACGKPLSTLTTPNANSETLFQAV